MQLRRKYIQYIFMHSEAKFKKNFTEREVLINKSYKTNFVCFKLERVGLEESRPKLGSTC